MQRDNVEKGMETKSVRCLRGSHVFNQISKARFELAPSEEERHLKPPPWTARPSRHSRIVTSHGRCMSRAQPWVIISIYFLPKSIGRFEDGVCILLNQHFSCTQLLHAMRRDANDDFAAVDGAGVLLAAGCHCQRVHHVHPDAEWRGVRD